MTTDIIDPRFLTVQDWTDSMVFPIKDKAQIERLNDPNAWKEWAFNLIQYGRISFFDPPDPRFFDDWREWAFRFNQAIL